MMLEGDKVILREKQISDAQDDYRWRSDPELAELDASRPINVNFEDFLDSFSHELDYPSFSSHSFSITTRDGKHIGNCMYYDLNHLKREVEVGIMIGDREYWNSGYGADAMRTLVDHVFKTVGVQRVYLHTLEWNHRARRSFQKCGFREVRTVRRGGHVFRLMEITRAEWQEMHAARSTPQITDSGAIST